MTDDEATRLMGRVSAAYGRGFKTDTMTEWRRQLAHIDQAAADTALDRIIQTGEPGPSVARIIAEVVAMRPRHNHTAPIGHPDCEACDGTGWAAGLGGLKPCECRP